MLNIPQNIMVNIPQNMFTILQLQPPCTHGLKLTTQKTRQNHTYLKYSKYNTFRSRLTWLFLLMHMLYILWWTTVSSSIMYILYSLQVW